MPNKRFEQVKFSSKSMSGVLAMSFVLGVYGCGAVACSNTTNSAATASNTNTVVTEVVNSKCEDLNLQTADFEILALTKDGQQKLDYTEDFLKKQQQAKQKDFYYFFAGWCEAAKQQFKTLLDLQAKYGKNVNFYCVNAEKVPELQSELKIDSVPFVLLMQGEKVLWTKSSAWDKFAEEANQELANLNLEPQVTVADRIKERLNDVLETKQEQPGSTLETTNPNSQIVHNPPVYTIPRDPNLRKK